MAWMVAISACFFWTSSRLCRRVTPKFLSEKSAWKYANTLNSLLHATIVGLGVLLCLMLCPALLDDLFDFYFLPSHLLVSVSVGYFLVDFTDMAFNDKGRSNIELLVHHIAVVTAFSICLVTSSYMGHATVSMCVEVNSIFLHIRQILNFHKTPKSSSMFRIISSLTVGTFLAFRIIPVSWLLRTLVQQRHRVSDPVFTIGFLSYSTVSIMNIVLLYRIVRSDYLRSESSLTNQALKSTAAAIASKSQ